jgi:hypothetical protein
MGLPLAEGKPIEQPTKLAGGDCHDLFAAGRPLKRATFQAAVKKPLSRNIRYPEVPDTVLKF